MDYTTAQELIDSIGREGSRPAFHWMIDAAQRSLLRPADAQPMRRSFIPRDPLAVPSSEWRDMLLREFRTRWGMKGAALTIRQARRFPGELDAIVDEMLEQLGTILEYDARAEEEDRT